MIRLHDLGFGPKLSMAIYQFYMSDTLKILDENPINSFMILKESGLIKLTNLHVILVLLRIHLNV